MIHGSQQLIGVRAELTDAASTPIASVADDAVHFVSYPGDVSGNRRHDAGDAAAVARFVALVDPVFRAAPQTDPVLVADFSGNGRVNAGDASMVARKAALFIVSELPDIPTIVAAFGPAPVPEAAAASPQSHSRRDEYLAQIDELAFTAARGLPYAAVDRALLELNNRES